MKILSNKIIEFFLITSKSYLRIILSETLYEKRVRCPHLIYKYKYIYKYNINIKKKYKNLNKSTILLLKSDK